MSEALVPLEQKVVTFYEDEVTAVRMEDGSVYVPIRPLCDYLGISWAGQRERINRDAVLSDEIRGVRVTRTPGAGGGTQEMLCLPLDFLNGWLFGINASRVKDEVKERLIKYQRECYRILADAFQGSAVVTHAPSALVQVYEMGLAIAAMAKEQMAFDSRLGATEDDIRVVTERLSAVEEKLSPTAYVTQEQASQISQAVKTVALAVGKKTGRNEFGAVYGELYWRFEITSYKSLPAHKFEDALAFLTEWHLNVTTDVPF